MIVKRTSVQGPLFLAVQLAFILGACCITLDFQIDSSDENLIFLECISDDGLPSSDAIFEFINPLTNTLQLRTVTSSGSSHVSFKVTPATEADIRCIIDNTASETLSIAGECGAMLVGLRMYIIMTSFHLLAQAHNPKSLDISVSFCILTALPPSSFPKDPVIISTFRNQSVQLTCPIELGNLRNTLTPYSIMWTEGVMPFHPVMAPGQLSLENTVLTVTPSNSTDVRSFMCILTLRRCMRCQERTHNGPLMEVHVLGKTIMLNSYVSLEKLKIIIVVQSLFVS